MSSGTTYLDLLDAVQTYYGSGSDEWLKIAQYGVNTETIPIIKQIPGVNITTSNSGKLLGWDYAKPFATPENPTSYINSNLQTGAFGSGSFSANVPATTVSNPETGVSVMQSGTKLTSSGVTVASVADKLSLGVAGVALGTKLGKLIDQTLYNANPDFWDEHLPTINPATWDDIATTENGKQLIRGIFGLQDDSTTMYVDEQMLALAYMSLLNAGAWSSGGHTTSQSNVPSSNLNRPNSSYNVTVLENVEIIRDASHPSSAYYYKKTTSISNGYLLFINGNNSSIYQLYAVSPEPTTIDLVVNPGNRHFSYPINTQYTKNGQTLYYGIVEPTQSYKFSNDIPITINGVSMNSSNPYLSKVSPYYSGTSTIRDYCMIALYGTIVNPAIDGIDNNPNATTRITPADVINPTTGVAVTPNDDPTDVLTALKNQYPDLFNNSIYEDVTQDDGTTDRHTYIPVQIPNGFDSDKPTTDDTTDPQNDPETNPENRPQSLLESITDTLTDTTEPPDTGDGSTPGVVVPVGSASALYSIYNPTQSELNSLGAWLWSSNFVNQLLKLFNDPMQAIIGLHKIFASPSTGGTQNIKVGYLDSGVSSLVVSDQYTTIDCGSVSLPEYYGNVFDYDPFTDVYIYLPFIGIEKLNTADVMRSTINVVYHVDVLTGACLAEININRDGCGGALYTYSGNCAVQYPTSSGSYMGIVASLASVAGGVVGTVATGGAVAPVAMGAVSGMLNAHTRVQHSGGFSGNAGAMGCKTPYLIITRTQIATANDFPDFVGKPANATTTLGNCSGFVRVLVAHLDGIPATGDEISEIETLLKTGILK